MVPGGIIKRIGRGSLPCWVSTMIARSALSEQLVEPERQDDGDGKDAGGRGGGRGPCPGISHQECRTVSFGVVRAAFPAQTASNDLELFPQPLDSFVQRRVRLTVEGVVVLVGHRFKRVSKIQGNQR